jgi:predicted nucleic acid-binding protein
VILLDTNVISELMRQTTAPNVLNWVDALDPETLAITAMNEAKNLHGLSRLHDGGRKQGLRSCWEELLAVFFTVRVLPFSSETAHWYVELLAHRERLGRTMHCANAVIADMALVHRAALATRDISDFTGIGLELINPWHLS